MLQQAISRFGGTPAFVLKLLFLGVINAVAIWAIPTMVANGSWAMLAVVVISTAALDFLLLTKRYIPAKYVVIGAILLTAFQIIPIVFNISIAFTNYSTGNIGTQADAVETIVRDSAVESDASVAYDMLPARNADGQLVLILTPQDFVSDEGTDVSVDDGGASPEASAETEFGGASSDPNTTEFGGDEASTLPDETEFDNSGSQSPAASEIPADADVPSADAADLPPTYIGTNQAMTEVPAAEVQRDEFGSVTGVTGYPVVPDAELPSIDTELAAIEVPGPQGGVIKPQGFSTAVELVPTLEYDPVANTFTSLNSGVVYTDNGEGNFANPDNPEDYLVPGWREYIGFSNFTAVFTDPQIRDPFFFVFIWTFLYAILTVLLTFVVGLGLAITLNKEKMRGQRIYRSLLVVPYAVPSFLSILVWAGILNDDFGALNQITGWTIPWLFDPFWARVSVIGVSLWLGFPYMFLVSTGALQAIPKELQEASRVDGARAWQIFRLVNLPLLLVALAPLLIASFAFNFNNFNNIFLLTGGGPAMDNSEVAGATDILISYTYKIAFSAGEGNDYGLASAISLYIFLIVGTISAVSFARSKALREER